VDDDDDYCWTFANRIYILLFINMCISLFTKTRYFDMNYSSERNVINKVPFLIRMHLGRRCLY
jgi:hypothetical protein